MKHIISLGAGVQSSTMALMAAAGELTPMPDCAIFADTQAEPASVYRWLDWLEKQLPFPVNRVSAGNLGKDSLSIRHGRIDGRTYIAGKIPLFSIQPGNKKGMLQRRCTRDYKIRPIHREIKRIVGAKRGEKKVLAISWVGISIDEATRMKPSGSPIIDNRWPLIELKVSRDWCGKWMLSHGFPMPPRSACIFCPYKSDSEWLKMQIDEPEEFKKAIAWEKSYQKVSEGDDVTKSVSFIHRSRLPLSQVKFEVNANPYLFDNECEGMCGV